MNSFNKISLENALKPYEKSEIALYNAVLF